MKTRLFLFIIFVISITIPAISFAQKSPNCTFGDQTNLDHVFEKDFAVMAFTNKHQNATRSIPNEPDNINSIIFQAKNNSIKEALEIKFTTDEKGCFVPASYHYFYDDGIINATAKNSVANFTEIMNLIKSNDKSIEDFYPRDCDFVSLVLTITSGKSFGICKETTRAITILMDSDSDGTLKIDIPIKTLYSLPSKDCKPTGDFFVLLDGEEAHSEISPTDIGNSVKIEFPKGFHKVRIMGMVIIPDPSPDQYCGIVKGYLEKKYLSPLDQTNNGVTAKSIKCNDGLTLIQKYNDLPACVKPETKQKLIERGWTQEDTVKTDGSESKFKITGLDKYYHPDEPLSISIEKTGYDMCDDWSAKIIDYLDNSTVWHRDYSTSCVTLDPPKLQKFVYPVTNENNPLIISKSGDYSFQIDIGGMHLQQDIVIRQNMSGVSLDRTVYPVFCDQSFDDNEVVKYSPFGLAPSRMVFFVNQNTTAHICIEYSSSLDNTGTLNLESEQSDGFLGSNENAKSRVPVSISPSLIPLQKGSSTVADYSITIPSDAYGVYWIGASQMCERIPVVTSDYPLSPEDIPAIAGMHGCPAISLDAKLVGYSGAKVAYREAKPLVGR